MNTFVILPLQMVSVCGDSFQTHHHTIVDHAVGGGIVCSLDENSLRDFLKDTGITYKPQQDVIIRSLDELKRNTEAAVAALEDSGSPYTFTVVRALRTHNAAYVTFTKVCKRVCALKTGCKKFLRSCYMCVYSFGCSPSQ